jgi:hypothetical protein
METLTFFGLPGALAGLATGYLPRPGRLGLAVAIAVLVTVAFGFYGTTASGETASGWLGFIIAGFQLLAFAIGAFLGSSVRTLRMRHRGAQV